MTHLLDTDHLMASAELVSVMSDDGGASSFWNVLYPNEIMYSVQCVCH